MHLDTQAQDHWTSLPLGIEIYLLYFWICIGIYDELPQKDYTPCVLLKWMSPVIHCACV